MYIKNCDWGNTERGGGGGGGGYNGNHVTRTWIVWKEIVKVNCVSFALLPFGTTGEAAD